MGQVSCGHAQALEVASWSALLKAPRAVLAGDHLQLPPTVISEAAARKVCALISGSLYFIQYCTSCTKAIAKLLCASLTLWKSRCQKEACGHCHLQLDYKLIENSPNSCLLSLAGPFQDAL